MRVLDFIGPDDIVSEMLAGEKMAAIRELALVIARRHHLDAPAVVDVLIERERLASTGIGEGIAIPHGKLPSTSRICAVLGRSRLGVPFESIDGDAAHLFFVLVAPEQSSGLHLKALARISRLLKEGDLRKRLLNAVDAAEMYRVLGEEDAKH